MSIPASVATWSVGFNFILLTNDAISKPDTPSSIPIKETTKPASHRYPFFTLGNLLNTLKIINNPIASFIYCSGIFVKILAPRKDPTIDPMA